ncbi:MAG: response regulator [Azospirillaceae bacterium]|nr:response regulator [Azospirillaceae bacterium]
MPEKVARILVVEDDYLVALDLGHTVIDLGHTLSGYATGAADALAQVAAKHPTLVLMDIRLGTSDGLTAAKAIHEHYGLPIIFVSGHAGDLDGRGLVTLGPIVPKPFSITALRNAIDAAIATVREPTPNPAETADSDVDVGGNTVALQP